MNRPLLLTVFLFAVLFSLSISSLPAEAHKLNVFCWTGDNQVYGEAFFSGGRKAKNVPVHVQDAESHAALLTTQTDKEGKFQFTPPQQAVQQELDLLVTVNTGDGHRGEWLLTADEYLLTGSVPAPTEQPSIKSATESVDMESETVRTIARTIVRQELDRELVPIKRELAEAREKKVNPRDILGGIGCIIGLAALFGWIQSNKKKKKKISTEG
ncbi:MAG: hypothetical protein D3903_05835 [Candidatus Electrothrix sp. GM3_4]|nr:hypothetical protein [Candidatus Electrothrix sp. GM3_4]